MPQRTRSRIEHVLSRHGLRLCVDRAYRYIGPFLDRVVEWEKTLNDLQASSTAFSGFLPLLIPLKILRPAQQERVINSQCIVANPVEKYNT